MWGCPGVVSEPLSWFILFRVSYQHKNTALRLQGGCKVFASDMWCLRPTAVFGKDASGAALSHSEGKTRFRIYCFSMSSCLKTLYFATEQDRLKTEPIFLDLRDVGPDWHQNRPEYLIWSRRAGSLVPTCWLQFSQTLEMEKYVFLGGGTFAGDRIQK